MTALTWSRKSTHEAPVATMPSGYSSRDVGDPSQVKKNKQSMADLKLRRLTELNNRLREDLERDRIPVSQAANRYGVPLVREGFYDRIQFTNALSTALLPTRIARRTSWCHRSGATLTRRTTRMRPSRAEAAALLCRGGWSEKGNNGSARAGRSLAYRAFFFSA